MEIHFKYNILNVDEKPFRYLSLANLFFLIFCDSNINFSVFLLLPQHNKLLKNRSA